MPFQLGMPRTLTRLPSAAFVCRQCLRHQKLLPAAIAAPSRPSASRIAQRLVTRSRSYATSRGTTAGVGGPFAPGGSKAFNSSLRADFSSTADLAALQAAGAAGASSGAGASNGTFPETNSRVVGWWLIGSAVSVFGIVIFGGLTRLTESGLSITEWRPVTGSLPPMSQEDWDSEFTKYRASPEFALLNSHMTLDEFKKIYFMEWFHRLWGRVIGLTFVGPAVYFVLRRRVTRPMALNLLGIGCLIGFQGFIGWWMVKSGLKDDLFAPGSHPRVSQYRLTAHLATAFVCYSWMLLSGLAALRTRRFVADPAAALRLVEQLRDPTLRTFRRSVAALTALVFLTAMSGALVAGLDAGLIYNEFPMMGVGLAPPRAELLDGFYSRRPDRSDLWWRNMLENPSLVQLDHRILATTTFCAVVALFAYSRYGSRVAAALPRTARSGMMGVLHLTLAQVTLGIFTLLYMVPTHLAATHQAGALALLTGTLVLFHRMRVPPATVALVRRRLLQLQQQQQKTKATGGAVASGLPSKKI